MTKQEARQAALDEMTKKAEFEFQLKVKECLVSIGSHQKSIDLDKQRLQALTYVPPTLPEVED